MDRAIQVYHHPRNLAKRYPVVLHYTLQWNNPSISILGVCDQIGTFRSLLYRVYIFLQFYQMFPDTEAWTLITKFKIKIDILNCVSNSSLQRSRVYSIEDCVFPLHHETITVIKSEFIQNQEELDDY